MPGVANIALVSTALGAGQTRIPLDTAHVALVRGFDALGKLDDAAVGVVPFSFGFFRFMAIATGHNKD